MTKFSVFPTAYWAARRPQDIAVVWQKGQPHSTPPLFPFLPERLSWQQFHQLLLQTVGLLGSGVVNQNIAYQGTHRLAGLLCYLAVTAVGGRIVMLNPMLPSARQTESLADLNVKKVITDHDFTALSEHSPVGMIAERDFQQPATLTLTSGSSGNPKAVVHSVARHLESAEGVCELMAFTASDSWLLSLPLYHVSGQGIVWRWLVKGAELRVVEDKADFYAALSACSHASLVPTQLQRYLAVRAKPTVQHILLGGTYLPPTLLRQAQQARMTTYAGYGMTEMASTICAAKGTGVNVGRPLKGREVRIEQDEIWVKGSSLALGYWEKDKLVPLPLQEGGWFATRDRGCWDQEGNLQVLGRLDNMFISGGENIQPEQVEQVLFRSHLVRHLFILPIKDAEFGQRPIAVVEFMEPFSPQAVEKLQQFAKQHLEKFKQPIDYLALDSALQGGIKISRRQVAQYVETILDK